MSVTQILDYWLPYTAADNKCGFEKAKKTRLRYNMAMLINDYKEGNKNVLLPDDIKRLIDEN